MSILNTNISFSKNQVVVTRLSMESGSLKVQTSHYDSLFFGSVGTLVHLSELQYEAFTQVLKERKLPEWNLEEYKKSLTSTGGKNRLAAWSKANNLGQTDQDCLDIHARKSEIFQQNMRKGLNVRSGVIQLLEQARAHGVKTAFVTTTPQGNVEAQFEGMKGLKQDLFDFYMSEADEPKYGRGKPTADPYLFAMKKLNVSKPLVFEDSEISMKSPLAANLDVIATPNNWCLGHNYGNALAIANDISEMLNKSEMNADQSLKFSEMLKDVRVRVY